MPAAVRYRGKLIKLADAGDAAALRREPAVRERVLADGRKGAA